MPITYESNVRFKIQQGDEVPKSLSLPVSDREEE